MYWLDPDGGSHSNAFLAYCDMTSYNGGWTMCYTTDEYAKPRTEVTYNPNFLYGNDGYRTTCNNIKVSWFTWYSTTSLLSRKCWQNFVRIIVLSKFAEVFWRADKSSPVACAKRFIISGSQDKERKMEEQRSSNFVRFCILENHWLWWKSTTR